MSTNLPNVAIFAQIITKIPTNVLSRFCLHILLFDAQRNAWRGFGDATITTAISKGIRLNPRQTVLPACWDTFELVSMRNRRPPRSPTTHVFLVHSKWPCFFSSRHLCPNFTVQMKPIISKSVEVLSVRVNKVTYKLKRSEAL